MGGQGELEGKLWYILESITGKIADSVCISHKFQATTRLFEELHEADEEAWGEESLNVLASEGVHPGGGGWWRGGLSGGAK